jgi:hypothetical protein
MTVLRKCTHIVLWNWPRRPHPVISSLRHSFMSLSFPYIVTLSHPRVLILSSHSPVLILVSSHPDVLFLVFAHSHILPSSFSHRRVLDNILHTRSYSHIRVSPYPHLLTITSYHPPILIITSSHPLVLRSQGPAEHRLWNAAAYPIANVGSIPGRVEPMNVTSCSRCKESTDESPTACKRLPAQE